MSLKNLIKNCKKSDLNAQKTLYELFSPKLFGVCLKYSRNKAEAEDNLQDAFICILQKIGQFKNKGSFEGWMKRICINTCLAKYRKQQLFTLVNEENIEEPRIEEYNESVPLQFLLTCVQELPNRYRLVFNLYVLDGYAHQEVADMLGITEGTSKSNLARARAILKTKVEAYQKKLRDVGN
ncbi:RNA polymerase sigma factor [Psychroflexus salis]|uniref:DNA-directed RNA polymerase sigma-70 factor n=1 Tax=Psychroflexus salis TaxID=1526574 RepID=A0A916ZTL3_9FLAO|nr:RNA polymerase sigma factor [Psychroflexus salis]GGE13479.1 DNA-directed RNA polymerase sigma-70 factor [Psychroflexus salis]